MKEAHSIGLLIILIEIVELNELNHGYEPFVMKSKSLSLIVPLLRCNF